MIYAYKYLVDDIEKLHEYVEAFFHKMYLRSTSAVFNQSLLDKDFLKLAKSKPDLVLKPIKSIHTEFKKLDSASQKLVVDGFKNNNSIEDLCKGTLTPMLYPELKKISSKLSEQIKILFSNLYEEIINKEYFSSKKQHFINFRTLNESNLICPFCGLNSLLSDGDGKDNKKDDYDHWLSKGKYPFNSVNFKNLVPMCAHCNQKYKQQKNTIFETPLKGKPIRKKTFYPYGNDIIQNGITVNIIASNTTGLKNDNWSLELIGPSYQLEEIESWNRMFDIKTRYKNKIKTRYSTSWFEHVKNLYKKRKANVDFDFIKFKKEIYENLKLPNLQEAAIVEKAYYDYLFSDNDFQSNLDTIIGSNTAASSVVSF